MRKNFENKTVVFPLPVLLIGTYDENGNADVMNAAWGGQCGPKHIELNLSQHKTTDNLKVSNAFTISFPGKKDVVVADYFGIASGKNEDKIAKSGVHVTKSEYVNAPVVAEFPVTLECRVISMTEELGELRVVGEVVNMSVDETVLDEKGSIDADKFEPISYDPTDHSYRVLGGRIGHAFRDGAQLK